MVQYERTDLFKRKVHTAIFLQTYPEVVRDLISRHGAEKAAADLREVGSQIAHKLTNYWTPKSKKIKGILEEMYKKFWAGKPKILVKGNTIYVHDRNCPLCASGAELEVFPLCLPISSFLETMLHILSITRVFPFTKAEGRTTLSKGAGAKFCEHVIELSKEADIWKSRRADKWLQKS